MIVKHMRAVPSKLEMGNWRSTDGDVTSSKMVSGSSKQNRLTGKSVRQPGFPIADKRRMVVPAITIRPNINPSAMSSAQPTQYSMTSRDANMLSPSEIAKGSNVAAISTTQ